MRVVCLMTALPPTVGHLALLRFAALFASTYEGGEVVAVVSSRPSEPIDGDRRAGWLAEAASAEGLSLRVVHLEGEDSDPEEPRGPDDEEFWRFWADGLVFAAGELGPEDYVCSSESYGPRLAAAVGCRHLPYDPSRRTQAASGTKVRATPGRFFYDLVPPARRELRMTATFFGAESVGKTTLSLRLSEMFRARWTAEWARPYLEGEPDGYPTPERMDVIWRGQAAAQVVPDLDGRQFAFRDTDLLSTIGYYRLLGLPVPEDCLRAFEESRANLYLLVSQEGVPFEPDPLRYGGDRRESADAFWRLLLEEFGCEYRTVRGVTLDERVTACQKILGAASWRSSPLWRYERPRPTLPE